MAWQASLKSVTKAKGIATVTITYTDGAETFDKSYQIGSPGDSYIPKQAAQELRNLNDLDAFVAAAVPGPIDTSKVGQKPAELAADAWFAKARKLQNLKDAQAKGFDSDAAALSALEADVKADFRQVYVTDQRWQK
jgi:hypothetical protein